MYIVFQLSVIVLLAASSRMGVECGGDDKQEIIRLLHTNQPFFNLLQSIIPLQPQPMPFQPPQRFQPPPPPGTFLMPMPQQGFQPMPPPNRQSFQPAQQQIDGADPDAATADVDDDIFADCGIVKPKVTNFVSGGSDANHDDWPWYVQLIIHNTEYGDSETYCGGTVITKNHILTAAHCFDDMSDKFLASSTRVLFKGLRLDADGSTFEARVSRVIRHYEYVPAMTDFEARIQKKRPGPLNDLALLVLKRMPDSVHRKIVPACLPSKFAKIKENTLCKVMGHGFTSPFDEDTFTMPAKLQIADVRISSNQDCRNDVESKSIKEKINDRTVCVRGKVQPCVGDSGGPLVCSGSKNYKVDGSDNDHPTDEQVLSPSFEPRRWYICGVTSFAVSTDESDKCGNFKSAVFGLVPAHLDWIKRLVFDKHVNSFRRRA